MNYSKNDLLIIGLIITNILQFGIFEYFNIFEIFILFALILCLFQKSYKFSIFLNDQLLNGALLILPILTFISTFDFGSVRFANTLAFSVFFILTYSLGKNYSTLSISNLLFPISIFSLAINFIGVIKYGLTTYRFGGLFINPNESGRFCYFMFISVLITFFSSEYNIFKKFKFYTYFFLISMFTFSIISNSRIIIILLLVTFIFSSIFFLIKKGGESEFKKSYQKLKNLKINKNILIALIFILIFFSFGLFDNLFQKLMGNSYLMIRNLDYSNGRFMLWSLGINFLLNNIGGVNDDLISTYDLGSIHNNYIYFAIRYGLFSSIIYHLIFIRIFIFSTKYIWKTKNAFFTACLTIQMLIYWLLETASVIFPIVFIIYSYGLLIKEINQKKIFINRKNI